MGEPFWHCRCGEQYDRDLRTCPSCGTPRASVPMTAWRLLLLFVLGVASALVTGATIALALNYMDGDLIGQAVTSAAIGLLGVSVLVAIVVQVKGAITGALRGSAR